MGSIADVPTTFAVRLFVHGKRTFACVRHVKHLQRARAKMGSPLQAVFGMLLSQRLSGRAAALLDRVQAVL